MPDPAAWGVEPGYRDVDENWVETPASTVSALLDALEAEDDAPPPSPVVVARVGSPAAGGRPLGYHSLDDGRLLVVAPPRCHLPEELRAWGFAVQLYSLWSRASGGIGDLEDLRAFGQWAAGRGAGMALVSPLHAPLPGVPQQPSPYYPSSRCFRNPLHLRVPGVVSRPSVLLDRDAVYAAKMAALESEFSSFAGSDEFDAFCLEQGPLLFGYAAFCARHEGRESEQDRVRFHCWVQWKLDEQLAAAGAAVGLVHDLAVGFDPAGADAWLWRDVVAADARVGAPPDEFNQEGQDWGFPPFNPWKLQHERYEPFIRTVRAGFRHAAGLRVDHVMGLFRLWWIPPGASGPAEGGYVRYPAEDLLAILALESVLARAYVVGEDLGTVDPAQRAALASHDVLSYRLLWFEDAPPSEWPVKALAAVTTHDLPTIAGVLSGGDEPELASKLPSPSVAAAYDALAAAPSVLVAATLEDVLEVPERPNQPGTVVETNWSRPLPLSVEEIEADPRVAAVIEKLNAHGREAPREAAGVADAGQAGPRPADR